MPSSTLKHIQVAPQITDKIRGTFGFPYFLLVVCWCFKRSPSGILAYSM